MRTTLHVDDEAYRIAMRHARARKVGLGRAVSDLIVRGDRAGIPLKEVNGLLIFDPPKDMPKLTVEQVKRFADEW